MKKTSKPLISVIIVTYNSEKYINDCINALKKQYYKNFEIILIDNGSIDNTLDIIKNYSFIRLIKNKTNLGFSKANNQGIKIAKGEYILLLNPDAFLTKNSLQLMLRSIISDRKIAFIAPKLLKLDKKTLDSTGIMATSERRFFDRGRGEIDHLQFNIEISIFAGCGAALFLRKKALDDIKIYQEYLDENFFTYYEDVDLCWRLRLMGWNGLYSPESVVYHVRGHDLISLDNNTLVSFIKARHLQRRFNNIFLNIRRYAFRNSLWLLLKNDSFFEIIRNFFPFVYYWIRRIGYIILFEPYVLKEIPNTIRGIPNMLRKRKIIQQHRRIQPLQLRPFFKR